MKIVMVSTDRKIFEKGSRVRARMVEYGELFDELHIIIFSLKTHQFEKTKLSKNVMVYPTDALTKLDYILNAYHIAKKLIAKNPEKWIVTTQDPFETGLVGALLKKKYKMPLHVQIHGDFWSPFYKKESSVNKIRLLISRFVIPKASCLRAVSKRIKEGAVEVFNPTVPVTLLPIAEFGDIQNKKAEFDVHKKFPQFEFIAVMASRLERVKNIALALQAFRGIVKQNPKAGLLIVGDGSERSHLEYVAMKLNLTKNVIFLGWQDSIISYMKTADVFLNTSNHEGYCLSLVEAALAKCPIVTTDVGVVGEVLNESNTLVCPVGDKRCIESRLSIALLNKNKLSKLGEQAFVDVAKSLPRKERYLTSYKENIISCT